MSKHLNHRIKALCYTLIFIGLMNGCSKNDSADNPNRDARISVTVNGTTYTNADAANSGITTFDGISVHSFGLGGPLGGSRWSVIFYAEFQNRSDFAEGATLSYTFDDQDPLLRYAIYEERNSLKAETLNGDGMSVTIVKIDEAAKTLSANFEFTATDEETSETYSVSGEFENVVLTGI